MTYPRVLGVLALVWAVRLVTYTSHPTQPRWVSALIGVGFVAAGALLATNREVRAGAGLLALLSAVELLLVESAGYGAMVVMWWAAVIVAVTHGRPAERALLLRVCATCLYAFAGLAKINPSFLAGDQIVQITASRPHMAWAAELAAGPAGIALAWATIALELWLAVGLWLVRTRAWTAVAGVLLHASLAAAAAPTSFTGVLYMIVFNFGVVALYLSFWCPIRTSGGVGADRLRTLGARPT